MCIVTEHIYMHDDTYASRYNHMQYHITQQWPMARAHSFPSYFFNSIQNQRTSVSMRFIRILFFCFVLFCFEEKVDNFSVFHLFFFGMNSSRFFFLHWSLQMFNSHLWQEPLSTIQNSCDWQQPGRCAETKTSRPKWLLWKFVYKRGNSCLIGCCWSWLMHFDDVWDR